jgi:hypothetical protein
MLPILIGAGLGALLLKALFDGEDEEQEPKKIFVSFAIEDSKYRDFLVAQAKNEKTPFSFIDMSVKQPWNENEWKRKCRTKIKSCDGMIVLLSKKTWHSGGSRWEIKCANEEGIPVIGMHIKKNDKGAIPPELEGSRIIEWSWDNLSKSIKKI